MTTGEVLPYIRVDEELKGVVQRVQAFFRLAEGKKLTEGSTVKEIFKECSFSIAGPDKSIEVIHYPFASFEVKHVKSNRVSRH